MSARQRRRVQSMLVPASGPALGESSDDDLAINSRTQTSKSGFALLHLDTESDSGQSSAEAEAVIKCDAPATGASGSSEKPEVVGTARSPPISSAVGTGLNSAPVLDPQSGDTVTASINPLLAPATDHRREAALTELTSSGLTTPPPAPSVHHLASVTSPRNVSRTSGSSSAGVPPVPLSSAPPLRPLPVEHTTNRSRAHIPPAGDAVELLHADAAVLALCRRVYLVSSRNMNPDKELSRFLNVAGGGAGAEAAGPRLPGDRRGRGAGGAGAGRTFRSRRDCTLVQPEEGWLPPPTRAAGGFSMVRCEGIDATHFPEFELQFSDEYVASGLELEVCVNSMDPMLLQGFVQRHPYNLEGLLHLADYLRTSRNHGAARTLLRRAVFVLECAFHPAFQPGTTLCAVSPSTATNHIFYKVLTRYAVHAGSSGAATAAFNIVRMLLQTSTASQCYLRGTLPLSPSLPASRQQQQLSTLKSDPLQLHAIADYFALRSGDNTFVVSLTGETTPAGMPLVSLGYPSIPCVWLPNLAFSRALALFRVESAQVAPSHALVAHAATAAAPATRAHAAPSSSPEVWSDLSYTTYEATRMLVRAALTYPQAVLPLLTAIGLTPASVGFTDAAERGELPTHTHMHHTPPSRCFWQRVFTQSCFSEPFAEYSNPREGIFRGSPWWTPTLYQLIRQWADRHSTLFKVPEVICWLYGGLAIAGAIASDASSTIAPSVTAPHSASCGIATSDASSSQPRVRVADFPWFSQVYSSPALATAEYHSGIIVREALVFGEYLEESSSRMLQACLNAYASGRSRDFVDDVVTLGDDELRAIDQAEREGEVARQAGGGHLQPPTGRMHTLDVTNHSVVRLFFESLLPWNLLPRHGHHTEDERMR